MDDRGAVPLTNDNVSRLAGAPKANISSGTQSRRRTRVPEHSRPHWTQTIAADLMR